MVPSTFSTTRKTVLARYLRKGIDRTAAEKLLRTQRSGRSFGGTRKMSCGVLNAVVIMTANGTKKAEQIKIKIK